MSDLTEIEIFDCMTDNIKLAVDCCEKLARDSVRGEHYEKLRDALGLIEGCCQQASAHREDTRWLNIAPIFAECHKKAGDWLRGYKVNGETIHLAFGELNLNFVALAKGLRQALRVIESLRDSRTGQRGPILPEAPKEIGRQPSNYQIKRPSGLIVPAGAAA